MRRYSTSQVEALEFLSAERANPRAVSGRSLEAPAGTELVVRTVEKIDSRHAVADQTFSAIVGIALLAVLLDVAWKRARDRGEGGEAAAPPTG